MGKGLITEGVNRRGELMERGLMTEGAYGEGAYDRRSLWRGRLNREGVH